MYSYLCCKNCFSKLLGYYMQLSDNLPMLVHSWKRVDASVNSLDATTYTVDRENFAVKVTGYSLCMTFNCACARMILYGL